MVETKRHFQRPRRFILALLIFIVGCSGDPSGAPSFFSLGTAGTGGIYYPLGGVIASLLTQADENQIFNAEVTGGAVENINRIRAGQMELAFATANTVYDAYFGSPEFNGTVPDLRVVAPLYPNPTHILVAEGSEAQSIEDFRGLRVSVGAPGSGTEQISKRILEAHGLTYQDVDVRYLSFNESASALRDRAIDAAIISVGYPAAAILEATATGGARLLPITPSRITQLIDLYPYFGRGEIPGGIYPGLDEPISTAIVLNWIVASETLPNNIVINVLNLIANDRQALENVSIMAREIDLAFLEDAPIPVHPGVEQWWSGIR